MSFFGAVALPGCTLIVWRDASTPASCADDDDCPADEGCVGGSCEVVGAGAVPVDGVRIDIVGGVVVGPDGVEFTIAAGAVNSPTVFLIQRETSTLPRDNFDTDDRFYRLSPASSFATPALVRLPGDGADAFLQPIDGISWQQLVATDDGRFELPRAGVVVRGAVTP